MGSRRTLTRLEFYRTLVNHESTENFWLINLKMFIFNFSESPKCKNLKNLRLFRPFQILPNVCNLIFFTTQLFKGQVSRSQPKDLETDLDKGLSIAAAPHLAVATALFDVPLLGELAITMVRLSESKDMTRTIGRVQPSNLCWMLMGTGPKIAIIKMRGKCFFEPVTNHPTCAECREYVCLHLAEN